MTGRDPARRRLGLTAACATALLLAPATAQAHVSIHPNTIPAGAFATLALRVPGEQENAHVSKIDTLMPSGFTDVAYAAVPGWRAHVIETKLAKPLQSDDGPIDSEVSQIVWTWEGPEGAIDNGQFADFPLSVAIPAADNGKALEFRTVETYSNGHVDRWIDASLEAANPAPRINVVAPGGQIEDVAGEEAGPTAAEAHADIAPSVLAAPATNGASKGLGIAALVLGALGFVLGSVAFATTRRRGG
ncbi:MAG TPA: YcnI family protein [Solirubrobacteraceae bacterium]|jgi:uncharacterized protein YcnI|nr:YcnI family protein [Solirubrobacteraceae bacterium]